MSVGIPRRPSSRVPFRSHVSWLLSLAPPLPHHAIGLHVASERRDIARRGQSEAVAQRRAQELNAVAGIRISGQGDGLRDVKFKVRSDEFRGPGVRPRGPGVRPSY
jgi:hypothetical protein